MKDDLDALMIAEAPTPEEIRAARHAAGLTQAEAARIAGLGAQSRWGEYESGVRGTSRATWNLFLLVTGQHPALRLVRRSGGR